MEVKNEIEVNLTDKSNAETETFGAGSKVISNDDVHKAIAILQEYKDGKANLESRVVEDELWWQLRHWEAIGKKEVDANSPMPASAWLFNSILNKHADAMDNYPEPVVLPRERSDSESAKTLSDILPVIMEYNGFDETYNLNWWEKLKHGSAVYGVFWNTEKENGLGDIDIRQIDLLNIFWEPGVTDIQNSRNLFITQLVDNDVLESEYPELKGTLKGSTIDVKEYIYDDDVDTTNKSVVVDWYYKLKINNRTVLHYAKFCGNTLLYASQNEEAYKERGYYDHALYPVVFDVMFPEKGTPVGFGYVSICKDPQLYIDKLQSAILENAMQATKPRYWISSMTGVNEDEFLDWSSPLVHVEGPLDDTRIKPIQTAQVPPVAFNVMEQKISEMKETSSNRDVSNGGSAAGVSAAAAIAALQEAGNKVSRDMIASSYRAYQNIVKMCIELIRQFYDETRSFRITGRASGDYQFIDLNNAKLMNQQTGYDMDGNPLFRKPIFDLKIKAQKKNPFSRMEENERAKELYSLGFFNPQRAQEALSALDMMNFEGVEDIKEKISNGATLMNMVQDLQGQVQQLQGILGMKIQQQQMPFPTSAPGQDVNISGGVDDSIQGKVMEAQTPMTGYGERLAKRSGANMDVVSGAATPNA